MPPPPPDLREAAALGICNVTNVLHFSFRSLTLEPVLSVSFRDAAFQVDCVRGCGKGPLGVRARRSAQARRRGVGQFLWESIYPSPGVCFEAIIQFVFFNFVTILTFVFLKE